MGRTPPYRRLDGRADEARPAGSVQCFTAALEDLRGDLSTVRCWAAETSRR